MVKEEKEIKLIPKFIEFSKIGSSTQKEASEEAKVDQYSEFNNLKKYVKEEFEDTLDTSSEKEGKNNNEVIISFVRMKDLTNSKEFCKRIIKLHPITSIKKRTSLPEDEREMYKPIITVGLQDICYLDNILEFKILINLHPCYRFLDSSIWHRYVPLIPYEGSSKGNELKNENFKSRLMKVLEDIKFYYRLGYYNSVVSYEFLEFQTRLLLNSYVAEIGKSAHSKAIYPFMFHSETEIENKTKNILIENKLIENNIIGWNLLLVDDYAKKNLKPVNKDNNSTKSKKEIIEMLINYYLKEYVVKFNDIFKISLLPNLSEDGDIISNSIKALKERMYDVILLDYLLERKKNSDYLGKNKNRYYGDELLKKFSGYMENKENTYGQDIKEAMNNRGPMGRFWIFPISAFSDAMLNSIRERGISHFTDLWHLSSGADPINTPNLFIYKFFAFLNEMKSEALFNKGEMIKFFKNNMIHSCLDNNDKLKSGKFINDGESQENESNSSDNRKIVNYEVAIKWASSILGKFLYKFGKHEGFIIETESISKDNKYSINGDIVNRKSFRESMCRYIYENKKEEKQSYEHIKNMLLLLAYGTGMEWPEMWEEVQHVEDIIGEENYKIIVNYISKMQSVYG